MSDFAFPQSEVSRVRGLGLTMIGPASPMLAPGHAVRAPSQPHAYGVAERIHTQPGTVVQNPPGHAVTAPSQPHAEGVAGIEGVGQGGGRWRYMFDGSGGTYWGWDPGHSSSSFPTHSGSGDYVGPSSGGQSTTSSGGSPTASNADTGDAGSSSGGAPDPEDIRRFGGKPRIGHTLHVYRNAAGVIHTQPGTTAQLPPGHAVTAPSQPHVQGVAGVGQCPHCQGLFTMPG
jgi:hypothetical protein